MTADLLTVLGVAVEPPDAPSLSPMSTIGAMLPGLGMVRGIPGGSLMVTSSSGELPPVPKPVQSGLELGKGGWLDGGSVLILNL